MFHNLKTFLLILTLISTILTNTCLQYHQTQCIRCDSRSVLIKGRCREIIYGCLEYRKDGCKKCQEGNMLIERKCVREQREEEGRGRRLEGMGCNMLSLDCLAYDREENTGQMAHTMATTHTITTTTTTTITNTHSTSGFTLIPLSQIVSDPFFLKCDSFMRQGQYSHFISQSISPYHSISTQSSPSSITYRIIYYSAGDGLMLCLIDYNKNQNKITLQSFVAIGANQVIPFCMDYSSTTQCYQCRKGYHLEDNSCYSDIQGCVSYYKELCMECSGWALLIENRCLRDCPSQCDLTHVKFYGNFLLQTKR